MAGLTERVEARGGHRRRIRTERVRRERLRDGGEHESGAESGESHTGFRGKMRTMKKLVFGVLLAAAALPAAPFARGWPFDIAHDGQTRNQATVTVDPSLYQQVYYRPLSPVW